MLFDEKMHGCLLQRIGQRCSSSSPVNWPDSQIIRSTFVNYFRDRNHSFVPSSTVLAKKHEGTYFVNAGMNQARLMMTHL